MESPKSGSKTVMTDEKDRRRRAVPEYPATGGEVDASVRRGRDGDGLVAAPPIVGYFVARHRGAWSVLCDTEDGGVSFRSAHESRSEARLVMEHLLGYHGCKSRPNCPECAK